MWDRDDLQALAELRWTGNAPIAQALEQATPEQRGLLVAQHWIQVAIYRPKTFGPKTFGWGLLRRFVLLAIERWAAARCAATVVEVELEECPPEGCLCPLCPLRLLFELGFRQIANELHSANPLALPWMIRDGYRRAIGGRVEAQGVGEALRFQAAVSAFEELAVAHGVDLEERLS